jgi:CelD/BcsL family acetyltransferase involved in cellulose biosynthesis
MKVSVIDPISDPRWFAFVKNHPDAGIFHTPGWLEALKRTYGYRAVAYVNCGPDQELVSGIPFCRIQSVLTGRRLVSLPFSDHCQPLVSNADQLAELFSAVKEDVRRQGLKYAEFRPLVWDERAAECTQLDKTSAMVVHRLSLSGGLEEALRGFHKSCILRVIRSHEHGDTGLRYEEGRSDALLSQFYRLLLLTRRKHRIPPQPFAWFRNLRDCLNDSLTVRVLSNDKAAVAAAITLSFRDVVDYKYSCSDPAYKGRSATVLLIWRIIQDAVAQRATELDLGRSDLDTPGLITFKDRWGAAQAPLIYFRYPVCDVGILRRLRTSPATQVVLSKIPDSLFKAMGRLLYHHVG